MTKYDENDDSEPTNRFRSDSPVTPNEWRSLLSPLEVYLSPRVGVVAVDTEQGARVLIVEERDSRAEDVYLNGAGMTVAEANPEYPKDDRVYTVVSLESLLDEAQAYTPDAVARDAQRQDFHKCDFPRSRLSAVAPDRISLGDFEQRGSK
jgi:hypothetical protein